MAGNFTKATALHLLQQTGAGASSTLYKLADEQKEQVIRISKSRSLVSAYGNKLPSVVNKGSITYTLNGGEMTIKDKTQVGQTGTTWETTGFIQKTIYLSKPGIISGAIPEADNGQITMDATAIKFSQALNQFDRQYEREGMKAILKTVSNVAAATGTPDFSVTAAAALAKDPSAITTTADARAVKDQIVDKAFDLSEIRYPKYNIDGILEDEITIDLSSKLFNRLVQEDAIDDAADATFAEGIFRIGKMGGFRVRRNEFLGHADMTANIAASGATAEDKIVHAVIFTGYAAASPRAFIAANAGKYDNLSEDTGYFVEQKFASTDGVTKDYAVQGIEGITAVFTVS